MDVISASNLSILEMNIHEDQIVDRRICLFLAIIKDSNTLSFRCQEKKVITWLREKETKVAKKNKFQQDQFIYSQLCLSPKSSQKKIQNRKKVALQYVRIIEQYVPNKSGNIKQAFNYYQLVEVVKTIFNEHIRKSDALFVGGIAVVFYKSFFLAKVENKRIFIIFGGGAHINKGSFGTVSIVYDIASQQFLALKQANQKLDACEQIQKEVMNLNDIHDRAAKLNLSVEGLQSTPLATFYIDAQGYKCVGFAGLKYGVDLFEWLKSKHSNQRRIEVCKLAVEAFKNKWALGYWHGDIKLENILITERGVVIIDWAGAILLQDAAKNLITPDARTDKYLTSEDYNKLCAISGMNRPTFSHSWHFVETAASSDLFALSIVLFIVLTSKNPFYLDENKSPDIKNGIIPENFRILFERKYPENVIQTIKTMLACNLTDRYSSQEVFDAWNEIS